MASEIHPSARVIAAKTLARVIGAGESLSAVLPKNLNLLATGPERGFCQELCYGSLRWHGRLEPALSRLIAKPLKNQDRDISCLLLLGLYQLSYLDIPPYAAVDATVQASQELGKPWARGLINAVLRRFQRERDGLLDEIDRSPAQRHACPEWLYRRVTTNYPDESEEILSASTARPPMSLRINVARTDREAYLSRLDQAGISALPHPLLPEAVILNEPRGVSELPGFVEGDVSVQDAGAQLAAHLLAPKSGMRVLDACAAPGGKSAHILELTRGAVDLTTLDHDSARIERLRQGLERLQLKARVIHADAANIAAWWDQQNFDRILVDAPCSGSGVIRRHPDIKLLRRDSDIAPLVQKQRHLLDSVWTTLAAGGRLLYCTCSIFREENQDQVAAFLANHTDARRIPAQHPALDTESRVLPGRHGMDGFYYALIEKVPPS